MSVRVLVIGRGRPVVRQAHLSPLELADDVVVVHKKEQELEAEDGRPVIEARSRRQRKTPARTRLTHRQSKKRAGKPDAARPKNPPTRT